MIFPPIVKRTYVRILTCLVKINIQSINMERSVPCSLAHTEITYKYILFLKIIIIFLCICRCLFLLRPSHRSETIRFDFVFTLAKDFHNSNCREFVINENIMVKVKSLSKKIHKTSNRKSGVIFLNLNKCFN